MKMVKSLLLGSAAGLVAVTAGQAADLPVKAKPVEYVKVCSLYGAGFYYMPGTDICLKVGGYLRAEITDYANGNLTNGTFTSNFNQRQTSNLTARARGYITADARNQTEYGTVRSYIAVGLASGDIGTTATEIVTASTYANRAFIQWAGITAGLAQSFYDFYSGPAAAYRAGYTPASDTGDGGWWIWGYTAQLGNGFSATLSAEQRRMSQIIDQVGVGGAFTAITAPTPGIIGTGTIAGTTTAGNGYGGWISPDIVGNLRVDQAWGGAQVMGAAHEVNALYYGTGTTASIIPASGHPSDQWGFAVGGGLKLNAPMIAQGDYFQSQVNYTHGALRYVDHGPDTTEDILNGNTQAYGVFSDCVFGGTTAANQTGCELTTAWGVNASFEHYWTPQWHESFFGSYMAVSYDTNANNMLCTAASFGAGIGSASLATPGCSNNWSQWTAGSRLQWDVTKTLYLGVEVMYNQINSASTPTGAIGDYALTGAGLTPTSGVGNQSNWVVTARIHRDFVP
jgi:Porin subfamily